MGAQVAKNGAKEETVAEKANGQENGHAKTNGNTSPTADGAVEEVQANGKHADCEVKAEDCTAEKPAEESVAESALVANGDESSKPEENGAMSGSTESAKPKKRFSFKKPFKLSGFSFKKNAKKETEAEEATAPADEGTDKVTSEEAKPEAAEREEKEDAAKEAKAEQPISDEEKKNSEEQKPESPAKEKPAAADEPAAEAPAPAESSDAQPAAAAAAATAAEE